MALPDRLQELRGARILLVEDNDINQLVAREMLEAVNLVVDVADNGEIALRKLHEGRYDLVFMDMQMPVMDGVTCTREIRDGIPRDIAGLDTMLGLSRMMNKTSLYLKILRRFADEYGTVPQQIRQALAAGDMAAAQRLAHSAKSVAGNVGASGVQRLAEQVETAIRDNAPPAVLQECLGEFERDLVILVTTLAGQLEPGESPAKVAV